MLTPVDKFLWAVTIAANLFLFIELVNGLHYKLFPYFATYNGFTLLKSAVLIFAQPLIISQPFAYIFVYYVGTFLSTALLVLVTLEIASDLFAPYSTIPVRNVINLLGASIVAGIIALMLSEFIGSRPHPQWWAGLLTVEKFAKFVLVGSLGVITYIAYYLGLPWFPHARGLACGLYFANVMQGLIQLLPHFNASHTRPFFMLAFIIAQMVWIHTFFNRWVPPKMPTVAQLEEQSETFHSVFL